ncbi:Gamma-tubulin complex component 4 like [Apostasia shenzhenica]|uniref:Gamma-tubulin complex component n=1 Tax=Apostasia shenzhenica TaxID=1088818 RepID=A0A2I0AYW1_9ASPA|nr:Gamma-tubulin complex component 4 like [Apostasia shenzhenica]
MLHELLLSLVGYTGDFVMDERDQRETLSESLDAASDFQNEPTFKLAPDLSFIQPSERDVIERLLPLGFYYKELDRFATKHRNLGSFQTTKFFPDPQNLENIKGNVGKSSVYCRAIANGIVEILSIYRSAVLQVEQNLLSNPLPMLATVTQGLNKFEVLLPPLYELIVEIEREDLRGGQLLSLLHKRCHCGVPELQACIQRLLWHGHQVLYNQLSSWMVYGVLHDPHREFFIRRQDDGDLESEMSSSNMMENSLQKSSDNAALADWHVGFHIFLEMMPDYIHMPIAESILFAGKAVRVLRNPSDMFKVQESFFQQHMSRGSQRTPGYVGNFVLKDPIKGTNLNAEELFPQSEADKIEELLHKLKKSSEFHKRSFECAVNSIRTISANHLWQLVVIRADLSGHLKALKDYFLLAKGDFFQCFLEEGQKLMRLPPRQSTAEADLMVPFQLAALKTISEEDKYFSRVSLRMPSVGISMTNANANLQKMKLDVNQAVPLQGVTSSELSVDGWDGIALEYSVDWPLHLFFTQEVLSKYQKVFQYLIRLKRTQMELEKSWANGMHQDHADFASHRRDRQNCSVSQQRRQRIKPMWRVREHMTFLIRNLQFYIQVDVIESQWNSLQAHVQTSHDFTELVSFHQEYLSALISQSFLDIGSVSRILDSIMKLCLQFCWNIEQYESNPNLSELEQIVEEFNKKSNSLYTILRSSRLAGSQRAPFLRQLLMRLNFNSFFEATARGVLNVVRQRPILPS